ncbi:hypothetical protein MAC_02786 [Metarhizium acridum CQMa 102]|uniref:Uncharacterized protein n=1 Tax=Metarhizium acridum (strain CQMa 102) TaxID=655827 RepID=E9DYT8_METAQ|nr:uncharacterized protein MAC_02786 [Metarhizium acridum CQMa 102]EFY91115.1 hypothetical protein MAC_02786 [Metarhizium acridum CQMa 102]
MESPVRVLIIVKQRSVRLWQEAWEEPQKMISKVLMHLNYNSLVSTDDKYNSSDCRFIAVERWDSVVFIVCDLFNINYNHLNAHLDGKNELPVIIARVSQGEHGYIIKTREPQESKLLGDRVRSLHDMHGWTEGVPYKIDHANGVHPIYYNPRSLLTDCLWFPLTLFTACVRGWKAVDRTKLPKKLLI